MPRRKRRSAWASMAEVKPGIWRIRYWAAGPDGYRRRSKTVRGSRLEAEKVRSELMLDHSEDAPCPTVRQAWERWVLPFFIEPMMGHKGADVTGRHYDKPTADLFAEVVADAYRARPWDAEWDG